MTQPAKGQEERVDIDPSIWVLFMKRLDSKQCSIRFPVDPVYRTTEGGFMARAAAFGEIFEWTVQKGAGETGDSTYELDGKWVHEHVVQSGEYLFKLRTYSLGPESLHHEAFVASLKLD
ncbi:MAG: hypothetical protein KGQ49_03750 [Verrucomicrobia bacterium]|nr:hypothetical protein [Verrucomicrobiota bacterium]